MCVIAKLENLYIKEFIYHYIKLGIKKIYLYDNNDILGEHFEDVLENEINSKFVEIINIRGKSKYQIISYNECYQKNLNNYSWFLFVDVDEYLFIKNNKSLNNFLNSKKFKDCDNILINYKEFGDSDLLSYDNRSLIERFNKNFRYVRSMKSLVRGGLKNAKINIHRAYNIIKYCNSEGEVEKPGEFYTSKIIVNSAEIMHYITKSTKEFYNRLIKGWPHVKHYSSDYQNFLNYRIRYYFNINNMTKQKIDILLPLIKDKNILKLLKTKKKYI